MYSKRGCIVTFGEARCEICWNELGWFAVNIADGSSSDYFSSERAMLEACEQGVANFTF